MNYSRGTRRVVYTGESIFPVLFRAQTDGTGMLPGLDSLDRTARIRQLGQNMQDMTAGVIARTEDKEGQCPCSCVKFTMLISTDLIGNR